MVPNFEVSTVSRDLALDAGLDVLNNGFLRIYSGAVPADADAGLGGAVLLVQLGLNAVAFAPGAGGSAAANAITPGTAGNTGTASFFRLYKSDGVTSVTQGLCGNTGSGQDLELTTTSIVSGETISCSSLVVTFPI